MRLLGDQYGPTTNPLTESGKRVDTQPLVAFRPDHLLYKLSIDDRTSGIKQIETWTS